MKAKRKNIFPAFVGYWLSSSIPLYDLVIRRVIHKVSTVHEIVSSDSGVCYP